ncbi:hypothetical protein [Bacillus sp. AFS055030]|uniref:hypothetical protein n=1 Tax=Bacillus sp. AFS055030 TaxID=2033507 RepID=UPI000BFBECE9|nr:hypothetical protein [Bacillus sp. AFS055030]PGL72072.1 hypothetical protein CN925_05885 [Bacillus sp. AFS055030]
MKKLLPLISLAITIVTAFIPTNPKELPYYHWFGKPNPVFGYTETGHHTGLLQNVIFNFLTFYLGLYIIFKIFKILVARRNA